MIGRNNVEIEGAMRSTKKAKIWSKKKRNKRLTQLTIERPTFIEMNFFLMKPDNGKQLWCNNENEVTLKSLSWKDTGLHQGKRQEQLDLAWQVW